MKRFLFVFALAVVLLVGGNANAKVAKAARVKTPIVEVTSGDQPEVTAIAHGGVFTQFTAFDVKIVGGKGGCLSLKNIRVEIYSDGRFGGNTPTIGQMFEKVCLIANTSPGNSEVSEKRIISSLTIDEGVGLSIDLGTTHWFGNNARFTVIGIPRDEVFYSENGRTIGLAVTEVRVDGSKSAKIRGSFPIMGTEQRIDPNAWAGTIYFGKTTLYDDDGRVHQAFFIHGTRDVFVKKIVFPKYQNQDAKVSVLGLVNGEYSCFTDKRDDITSCNFYKKERELSAESAESLSLDSDGIFLPANNFLYFYSKNDSALLNHFVDPNDIVVVGASMKYRYAPQDDGGGFACFLGGTKVKMSNGEEKDIEKIQEGESVWTALWKDGRIVCGSSKIKKVIKKEDPVWLSIIAGGRTVKTVPDQMFFTVGEDGVSVMQFASLIRVGDWIRNDGCGLSKVTSVTKPKNKSVPTWDLVLESGESYYADGFKVHSVIENED